MKPATCLLQPEIAPVEIDCKNRYNHFHYMPGMLSHLFLGNSFNTITSYKNLILLGGTNLNLLNTETGEVQYCNPGNESYTDWVVWKIDKGKYSGDYWIACQNGLNRLSAKSIQEHLPADNGKNIRFSGRTKQFLHLKSDDNSLSENKIWCTLETVEGKVLIGTSNGLDIYDPGMGTFRNFRTDTTNPAGFNGFNVSVLFEDSRKNIWVGTEEDGICLYHPEDKNFSHFTIKEGLSDNTVWGIEEDNSGCLWISTENGLNKFDPMKWKNRIYRSADGFLNDRYNRGASFKDNEGYLYFGGVNGLDKFLPENIKDNPVKPNVIFCNLYLFKQTCHSRSHLWRPGSAERRCKSRK